MQSFENAEKIIFIHRSGYAEAPFSNFLSGTTIKLQPWGTIEGVLKFGSQPAANQSVLLYPGTGSGFLSFSYDPVDYAVRTDADGKFTIANVPPGERRVTRYVKNGQSNWLQSHPRAEILVKPGEVTRVTLGGEGRPVAGQRAAKIRVWKSIGATAEQAHSAIIRNSPSLKRPKNYVPGQPRRRELKPVRNHEPMALKSLRQVHSVSTTWSQESTALDLTCANQPKTGSVRSSPH